MKWFVFFFSIISLPLFGQDNKSTTQTTNTVINPITDNPSANDIRDNKPIMVCQQMPKFKGDVNKYLKDSIHLPQIPIDSLLTPIYVSFIVEKDGSITGIKIINPKPISPKLSQEVIRVVSSMPAWSPGMQNNRPVRVQTNLPIRLEVK